MTTKHPKTREASKVKDARQTTVMTVTEIWMNIEGTLGDWSPLPLPMVVTVNINRVNTGSKNIRHMERNILLGRIF